MLLYQQLMHLPGPTSVAAFESALSGTGLATPVLRLDIPLERLDGMRVARGPLRIHVLRRGGPPWSFQVEGPGIHADGRLSPGTGESPPWLEVDHLTGEDETLGRLFLRLGDLVPAATQLRVVCDPETTRSIAFGVPLLCTRVGVLLWRAGARSSPSWTVPGETGGTRRAQASIPVDEGHRRQAEAEARADARRFLDGPLAEGFPQDARRARALVEEGDPDI